MKIAVLNNYPLLRVKDEVLLGETPNHLLFGINFFKECGIECDIIEQVNNKPLPLKYKILKKFLWINNLGDLYQQHKVIQSQSNYQIIYDASGNQSQWIQYLKASGRFAPPIVSLHHHRVHRGKLDCLRQGFRKKTWAGLTASPCLSKFVADDFNSFFSESKKAFPVQWGTDLSFYNPSGEVGDGLVVAGRTSRDYATVIRAINRSSVDATIIYLADCLGYDGPISSKIQLIQAKNEQPVPGINGRGWIKHRDLKDYYRRARVIGIPLYSQDTLAGFTSLMDCLGMGKPVIMTRNPNIDLDIEKEGIGHWVEPGDIGAWQILLQWYNSHPLQALKMGKRARELAEDKYNSKHFANQMVGIFKKILK